ncbi:hypothetical protein HanIR_Chr14g0686911 [Helianthus annuus]|nr:hypothetical protein HanIR_Chr14g0686911 [Helianthus annuus]
MGRSLRGTCYSLHVATYYALPIRLHFQNYGTVGIGKPMGIRVLSRR